MLGGQTVHLDGDDMRASISTDLDLSREGRVEHNLRIARLAKLLHSQGFDVVVSSICPYRDLRERVWKITGCEFIHLPGGKTGPEYPFESPD